MRHAYLWAVAWVVLIAFVALGGGMSLWLWAGAVIVLVLLVANGLLRDRLPRLPRDEHDDLRF